MALKRLKRKTPREHYWLKREPLPHEYTQQIIDGKTQLESVPAHLQSLVSLFLDIAKHADERLSVKYGAQIAMMKTLSERRHALAKVPEKLKERTEHHAKIIFEQLKKKRKSL